MANLEKRLDEQGLLPSRWWRYVDDIFSVIKRADLERTLEAINNTHKDIRFTHEEENEGKLPFLDLLITRELQTTESTPSFEVYRKPTNTKRVIPNTSNHSYQQKTAAFHHMAHRMMTLPLSDEGRTKELNYILETAEVNGYQERTVQAIINKKQRDLHRKSLTTLTPATEPLRRVSVPYNSITKELRPRMEQFGIDIVFSSRSNQLKTLLGSTKDPVETLGKAGIYKITCSHCGKVYIGQTKRTLDIRFKEHVKEVTQAKRKEDKGMIHNFSSKVAEHISREGHTISTSDINILRTVSTPWKLDVAESLEIFKQVPSTLLNRDQGNGSTCLFNLLP